MEQKINYDWSHSLLISNNQHIIFMDIQGLTNDNHITCFSICITEKSPWSQFEVENFTLWCISFISLLIHCHPCNPIRISTSALNHCVAIGLCCIHVTACHFSPLLCHHDDIIWPQAHPITMKFLTLNKYKLSKQCKIGATCNTQLPICWDNYVRNPI